jgi:hypothetical protein
MSCGDAPLRVKTNTPPDFTMATFLAVVINY